MTVPQHVNAPSLRPHSLMLVPHIRPATIADRDLLRQAVAELQEYEHRLHATRLPGEQIARRILAWLESRTTTNGAMLVGEVESDFIGFVAGWIEEDEAIAEFQSLRIPIRHLCRAAVSWPTRLRSIA